MTVIRNRINMFAQLLFSRVFVIFSVSLLLEVYLTGAFDSVARASEDDKSIMWEAEGGILSDGTEVVEDLPESGTAVRFQITSVSATSSASYLVYVPEPGVYRLMARIKSEVAGEASFTVTSNDEIEGPWNLVAAPGWVWQPGPEGRLSAGLKKLVIIHEEGQIQIDQLKLQLIAENPPSTSFWSETESILYVDPEAGDDLNTGASGAPLKTVGKALELVQPGWHIRLRTGVYQEEEELETQRAGLPDAPIVIEPDVNHSPVLDGNDHEVNALHIGDSYYTVRGLEFREYYEGLKIKGATGVVLEHNYIHDISAECILIKQFSKNNIVRNNVIHDCGLHANGEGIYIGTAPENRESGNDGLPDITVKNIITGNVIYEVAEGIDIKEDSSLNKVTLNYIHHIDDDESGAINVRGNKNFIYDNLVENNESSGIRIGGDVAFHPKYGEDYHYGINNVLRRNISRNNEGYGYKFMHGPQDIDETNIGSGNERGLFEIGFEIIRAWRVQ